MAALFPNSIRLGSLAIGVVFALAAPGLAADVTVQLDAGAGFSVKNSTGAIERLRVDEATGNLSRNGALFVHTTGTSNTFVGINAGNTSTTGLGANSAFGNGALSANTTGYYNSAVGKDALRSNTFGRLNSAVGYSALRNNTSGNFNSAVGSHALHSNTTGFGNTAAGLGALRVDTGGFYNSAVGKDTLGVNTTGDRNSALGNGALGANTTGSRNSAVGIAALRDNTTGSNNSAVGISALSYNTAGNRNVAVGLDAGRNQTTGSDNIYLANQGVAAESGKIKIGNTAHTETFIEGIDGNAASGGVAVLINSSNELHTLVSSARFKEAVRDMGEASDVLSKLRPVTFRYREGVVDEPAGREYGLIAEEVAEVAPDLVTLDTEGRPYSVRYHVLPALLLNEMQKQQRTIAKQRSEYEKEIAALTTRLARVEARK